MAKSQPKTFLVKAVRKGFYKKSRLPGQQFNFVGDAIPPWCVEVGAKGKTASKSKDVVPVTAAAAYIKTLKTVEEIEEFTQGDDRQGVLDAKDDAIAAIDAANE